MIPSSGKTPRDPSFIFLQISSISLLKAASYEMLVTI
jgi:hypothetical protein